MEGDGRHEAVEVEVVKILRKEHGDVEGKNMGRYGVKMEGRWKLRGREGLQGRWKAGSMEEVEGDDR